MGANRNSRRVIEVDKLSGSVINIYGSAREASEASGKSISFIRCQCNNNYRLPSGWSIYRWEGDSPILPLGDRPNVPILAYDGKTLLAFANFNEACSALEVSRLVLRNRMNNDEPIGFRGEKVYVRKAPRMGNYSKAKRYGVD